MKERGREEERDGRREGGKEGGREILCQIITLTETFLELQLFEKKNTIYKFIWVTLINQISLRMGK